MKALFFIVTGRENPERFSLALTIAARSAMNKRYDDLKVIFYGPGEEYLTSITGQDLENFNYLLKNGHVDSACVNYESMKNLKDQRKGQAVFGRQLLGHLKRRNDGVGGMRQQIYSLRDVKYSNGERP